jgi:hypothetical protein
MSTLLKLTRAAIALVAVIFCLTLAAPLTRADLFPSGDILDPPLHIGAGVNSACYSGGCQIWNGPSGMELNELSLPTLDIYQNSGGAAPPDNPLLLIFGVPVENLLLTAPDGSVIVNNAPLSLANIVDLSANPGTQGFLYHDVAFPTGADGSPADITFGAPPYVSGFAQGDLWDATSADLYAWLGLVGNNSHHFDSYADADVDVPLDLFGVNVYRPSGFNIFIYEIDPTGFDGQDAIRVDFQNIPIGSFAAAWGVHVTYGDDRSGNCANGHAPGTGAVAHRCDAFGGWPQVATGSDVYQNAITEGGLNMPTPTCEDLGNCNPPSEIPEPTSLVLLGSGLLGVATVVRKKIKGA